MEDTLGDKILFAYCRIRRGLNPCFNGRYSRSGTQQGHQPLLCVLILVLMEDTLGVVHNKDISRFSVS